MKHLIFFACFALTANGIHAQSFNSDELIGDWQQGVYDDVVRDSIVRPEFLRGGGASIRINQDSTVQYSSGFNCGFGYSKLGTWTIDSQSSTLIIHYTKVKPYREGSGINTDPNTEEFIVQSLDPKGLVLNSPNGGIFLYCRIL